MKGVITMERLVLDYPLSVLAIPAGNDLCVIICGGCEPHVGSVSVALPPSAATRTAAVTRTSESQSRLPAGTRMPGSESRLPAGTKTAASQSRLLAGTKTAGSGSGVTVKTTLLPGHRDDVIGDRFALALCEATRKTVVVSCGVHYDKPSRQDISAIVECAESMLCELIDLLLAHR